MNHDTLRTAVTGRVLLPGDDDFTTATQPWSAAVQQPVAAVVEPVDADDAAHLVDHARRAGARLSVQPSGHGASGSATDTILVRTGRLDSVHVDPERRTTKVGAGVTWGAAQAAAGKHGLTGLVGSSPGVSVTGFTLGGGLSWFGRGHGLAADSVLAFDVVLASGERAHVTADSEPELFWALRGGGGDFALVTAVTFRLHPAPAIYGGRMLWPGQRTREVFEAFAAITAVAPDELTLWAGRVQPPQAEPMVCVDLTHLGPADEARELLGPLERVEGAVVDTRGPVAVADLGTITNDPVDPAPVRARADLLTELDLDRLLAEPIDPLLGVQVRHLGGALARQGSGPAGPIAEPYLLYQIGLSLGPDSAAAVAAKQARVVTDLGATVTGRRPYTMLSPGDRAADAFDEPTLSRLRRAKRSYDPDGLLRANYPVDATG